MKGLPVVGRCACKPLDVGGGRQTAFGLPKSGCLPWTALQKADCLTSRGLPAEKGQPQSCVWLAAPKLCLAGSPKAVSGWLPKSCVWLAAQKLCPAGCPKAVSGWLPKSCVRLAAQKLCPAGCPKAMSG